MQPSNILDITQHNDFLIVGAVYGIHIGAEIDFCAGGKVSSF